MAAAEQLKCLVLPVQGPPVLVPNSAVAEIITQQDIAPPEDAPDWFLGTGRWRGTEIPLISLDRLTGEREDAPAPAGRFVVLFGLEEGGAPGFYGIRIESLPRTETLDNERLRPSDESPHPSEFIQARAVIGGDRECLIPDFDALGRTLGRYRAGRAD
ncbi:chemotaxis protein CheW [Halofilum ochraceum]|uniref:chemotaxis protein CheW n=1 Tax=Halofilum ochraceum TaxID=1611323 RepID=UPI0008DA85DA|nr:chemotaxis protein CheW [Halofilum ochraceum]